MKNDNFLFHPAWYELISDCDDAIIGEVFRASFLYWRDGVETKMKPIARVAFAAIRGGIDEDKYRFKILRENGAKGGRPKNQSKTKTKPKNNQTKTNPKPNDNQSETKDNQSGFSGFLGDEQNITETIEKEQVTEVKTLDIFGFEDAKPSRARLSNIPSIDNNNYNIGDNNIEIEDKSNRVIGEKGEETEQTTAPKPKRRTHEEVLAAEAAKADAKAEKQRQDEDACIKRMQEFKEACYPYCDGYPWGRTELPPRPKSIGTTYPDAMVADFVAYWNEYVKDSTTKTRRDDTKYFDTARRLATWKRNTKTYDDGRNNENREYRPATPEPVEKAQPKKRDYSMWFGKRIGGSGI